MSSYATWCSSRLSALTSVLRAVCRNNKIHYFGHFAALPLALIALALSVYEYRSREPPWESGKTLVTLADGDCLAGPTPGCDLRVLIDAHEARATLLDGQDVIAEGAGEEHVYFAHDNYNEPNLSPRVAISLRIPDRQSFAGSALRLNVAWQRQVFNELTPAGYGDQFFSMGHRSTGEDVIELPLFRSSEAAHHAWTGRHRPFQVVFVVMAIAGGLAMATGMLARIHKAGAVQRRNIFRLVMRQTLAMAFALSLLFVVPLVNLAMPDKGSDSHTQAEAVLLRLAVCGLFACPIAVSMVLLVAYVVWYLGEMPPEGKGGFWANVLDAL